MGTTMQADEKGASSITRKRRARPTPLKDPALMTLVYDDAFGSNVTAPDEVAPVEPVQ